jgi:uncharacterized circularly permuted ATP-grasp superfamily protein/uncharacterized alpha-E superfamily protein
MSLFESYQSRSSYDEVFTAQKGVREHWKNIIEDLEKTGIERLQDMQDDIDWHIEDNGVTFNIYDNNDVNSKRYWSMDPIPFVIESQEWNEIKQGLEQRAKLLNLILKDIYSQQKLLKENIIPAEVIYGHTGYVNEVYDFGFKEDFNLYFYAVDMARGPDGKMWIINDRTQAPSGLGYAIENRLTMNTVAQNIYPQIVTKKLFTFIEDIKNLLKKHTGNELSKAAFLTPGPHNETYFEHVYLSSFLEIPLVQGEDLLSKNGSLWLKSLSGLKKIDTLFRRLDDRYCDPLELRSDSRLGVPGLVDSMRQDNLSMMNPIGSAILENIGLNPFMEKICHYFLGEKLLLPQIATWWCGQKQELSFVIENIDKLIIKHIDASHHSRVYFGSRISQSEKLELIKRIQDDPHKYVAQEEISFSTVPYYHNGSIEPRNATLRGFCLYGEDKYSVMDGGLVRVSVSKDSLLVSSHKGATSKDLWILASSEDDLSIPSLDRLSTYVETSIDKIPTPKAENLFWLGRYLARSIATTRLISHIVKKITNFYRYEAVTSKEAQLILHRALTHMTMTYPGFLDVGNETSLERFPMKEITSVIKERDRVGSLAFTFFMLANVNLNLKDLLAFESSKLFTKMQKEFMDFLEIKHDTTPNISNALNQYLIYLMAYKELVKESIFKEQGLILYDIGYKIEMALLLISKARSMLCLKLDRSTSHDVLEGILNSMESFNAYRAQYKGSISLENVVDFLILNPQFPKSLTYMTKKLVKEFKKLPKAKENHLTSYEMPIVKATEILMAFNSKEILKSEDKDGVYTHLDKTLCKLSELFLECSNEFSNTYFSHYDE